MSGLFRYDQDYVLRIKPLLNPPMPPSPAADARHAEQLEAAGFVVIWDPERARQMHTVGMLQARTHCDGALWPYQRAAWKDDGLARWASREDVGFFLSLLSALNGGSVPLTANEAALHVERVLLKLKNHGMNLEAEHVAALEAVVRLGTPAQVLTFLETM